MKKNMYSLMLSPGIVDAIDRLAYEAGTNRSQMINNILAQYVSYRTPEMRIRDMFQQVEDILAQEQAGLKVMLRNSDSMMNFRSALAYKYNPTIHYSLELYRGGDTGLGELKAQLRTQSAALLRYINQFFQLWAALESQGPGRGECGLEPGRYTRRFFLPEKDVAEQELSQALAAYIQAFDTGVKTFFYYLDNPTAAQAGVQAIWQQYLSTAPCIL